MLKDFTGGFYRQFENKFFIFISLLYMLEPYVFDTFNFYSCINNHFAGVIKKAIVIQRIFSL